MSEPRDGVSADQALMQEMGLTDESIERRKVIVGLGPDDMRRLASLRDIVTANAEGLASTFFTYLGGLREAKPLFDDKNVLQRARALKTEHLSAMVLVDTLIFEREHVIRQQQEAIRELSTPVLQIRDQLLIIPVVGLLDTYRARLLTEGLLKAIRERRAKGVVMDITGVPIVDSKVANHLAQACEAARLMGALVVLTGISSEIALTLVTIGAELKGVRTVGDLQGGIEEIEHFLAGKSDALNE